MSENRQTTGRCTFALARGSLVLPLLVLVALLFVSFALTAAVLPPPPPISPTISIHLGWLPLQPGYAITNSTLSLTNITRTTNAGMITVRSVFTNTVTYYPFKPVTNYSVWLGTNKLATTNGLIARVIYPRGESPRFTITADLADGQSLNYGTLAFPPADNSALVFGALETASRPDGQWITRLVLPAAIVPDIIQFTQRAAFFRFRANIAPLGTNSRVLNFSPNTLLVTNAP